MKKRRPAPRRHVRLIEILPDDSMQKVAGDVLPVKAIKLPMVAGRGMVFTVSATAARARTPEALRALAQQLGDLVNPRPAALIVLPDGEELRAYEVVAD